MARGYAPKKLAALQSIERHLGRGLMALTVWFAMNSKRTTALSSRQIGLKSITSEKRTNVDRVKRAVQSCCPSGRA